jgi:mannosyl-oligosaccharide alpha-1,2-mannosidase
MDSRVIRHAPPRSFWVSAIVISGIVLIFSARGTHSSPRATWFMPPLPSPSPPRAPAIGPVPTTTPFPPYVFDYERLRSRNLTSPLYLNPFPRVTADLERQAAVKEAFLHAWGNYADACFGQDTYQPLSRGCGHVIGGGLTLVDSLSTILAMNLTAEFDRARTWVLEEFRPDGSWSLFEFIIRYLGGLVSAADMSGDPALTELAAALGRAILGAVRPTGGFFDGSTFSIATRGQRVFHASVIGGRPCIAETGTFQVEFLTLAKLTNESDFVDTALNVYRDFWFKQGRHGLIGSHIGACEDSYYEYVPKCYALTGGISPTILREYLNITADIRDRLVFKTLHRQLHGVGVSHGRTKRDVSPETEHLATFAGGMLALGSFAENPDAIEDLELAAELARTYATVYKESPSGVGPEHVRFNVDNKENPSDIAHWDGGYILRPESVESVYYLWKFTGLQKYRDYAWEMFQGINRSCRVEHGFTSIHDATQPNPGHSDEMESFFLAETLKYLYLTFSDSDILSPVDWVFNTEAHPMRIWDEETQRTFADLVLMKNVNYTDK